MFQESIVNIVELHCVGGMCFNIRKKLIFFMSGVSVYSHFFLRLMQLQQVGFFEFNGGNDETIIGNDLLG